MERFRQVIALTVWIIPLFFTNTAKSGVTGGGSFIITRLNNGEPIITQSMFEAVGVGSDGSNINGPSLLRIPDWIAPEHRADPTSPTTAATTSEWHGPSISKVPGTFTTSPAAAF
ncbi:MAG: hypothetical protein ACYSYL_03480 [Planctomycetota bacterium]